MTPRTSLAILALLLAAPSAAVAGREGYLTKTPADWTAEDAAEVLTKSPWVVEVQVFPNAVKSPEEAAQKPTGSMKRVPVRVGWRSAGVYRNAQAKQFQGLSPEQLAEMTRPDDRFYVIELRADESLSVLDSVPATELLRSSSLIVDGHARPLAFVVPPAELKAPQARFFFERGDGIPAGAKQAVFRTSARDLGVEAKFKLDKMTWQGKRDLDGDLGDLSPIEKLRREIQAAVLGDGDTVFHRAVADVRVEKMKDERRPWAAYVFYDPARELSSPEEARAVDGLARKQGIASRLGAWSLSNRSVLQAIVFVNPKTQQAEEFILGADAEKLSKAPPEGAAKLFKEKLTPADKPPTKASK